VKSKVVLTVEDEFLVRAFLDDVLAEAGFEVLSASNADDSMRFLETRDDICLIVTDVDMPGTMDGLALAALVRERWPSIEILITTGKPVAAARLKDAHFMPKPYSPAEVLKAVGLLCA
jgi:DNA-binding NtrC family response regulator